MKKELRYLKLTDEEAIKETKKRLEEMKKLLAEIRDTLKTAGEIE